MVSSSCTYTTSTRSESFFIPPRTLHLLRTLYRPRVSGSGSSFRLGVSFETASSRPGGATPLPSASVEATAPAASTKVSWGGMKGVKTSFGALLVDQSGGWKLYDESNATILQGSAPILSTGAGSEQGTIQLPVINGTGMHGGAEPCLSNGIFAPNYYVRPATTAR